MKYTLRPSQSKAIDRFPPFQTGEHEQKFIFSSLRVAAVLQWLHHVCRPDLRFPRYRIFSIYYDTPDRLFLREKLNSDYLKTKVRIRWYVENGNTEGTDNVWLEIKRKIGAERQKSRIQLPYPSAWFSSLSLKHPILTDEIPRILHTHGIRLTKTVHPFLELTYDRYRFLEPLSRQGVCVDCQIAVSKVNQRMLPMGWPVQIPSAILEIKGKTRNLPDMLQPLFWMGCRKAAVSKYLMCYQHLMHEA